MKKFISTLLVTMAVVVAQAQSFTTLKSFGIPNLTDRTGTRPYSHVIHGPDGTLYGTTTGETNVHGSMFKLNSDGTGFTVLRWFTNAADGANPQGDLALSGGVLYGTTLSGGSSNSGTIFKINTDGTGYTVLKHFGGGDGAFPRGLTVSGSVLYGTTSLGGAANIGTVFKINTNGTGYLVLKHFSGVDGAYPQACVTLSGDVLYGTTEQGGSSAWGTVFKVNTDGTGYAVLVPFDGGDAGLPSAAPIVSDGVLYGTTRIGGPSGADNGTVYKVNTDGTGYSVLKSFSSGGGLYPRGGLTLSGGVLYGTTLNSVFKMNTDGTGFEVLNEPITFSNGRDFRTSLTLSGNTLYGTAYSGGNSDKGTVFMLKTDGTDYTVLKHFTGTSNDGSKPTFVTVSGSVIYGTTYSGGSSDYGTVFRLNADGTGHTVLKNFTLGDNCQNPLAGPTLAETVLYGTTQYGGSGGTIYMINTDGAGFTDLEPNTESEMFAGLTLSGSTLYSTTPAGGSAGSGTVFKLNTDGTGYTVLKNFNGSDGSQPYAGLTLSDTVLYGTTLSGGTSGNGTLFKINTNGTSFAVLKHFTGSDGSSPTAGLTLSGNTLYGTTGSGGSSNGGTVFKVNTNGTGYTVLKNFTVTDGFPSGGVTLSGTILYGTTYSGGSSNKGTVFKVNTDGTDFAVLKHFTGSDGSNPGAGLTLSGTTLYGTTGSGGSMDLGTIFKINLRPVLSIQRTVSNTVAVSWPSSWIGFALQQNANGIGSLNWSNVTVGVQDDGTNRMFTVSPTGGNRFYRLVKP
jgi:uncharacterized repeat protein (TIGR03803 family)